MVFNSAYMLINKAIPNTGGPYTVRFYDDNNNLIQTDANVPQYGTAHCTDLDGTIVGGLYFKGWNPSPTNVIRDMDCFPVRGDYIIRHEETHDNWETICADAGAHYPLGTYKSLVLNIPAAAVQLYASRVNYNGNWMTDGYYTTPPGYLQDITAYAVNAAMDMVKVAEGEDGSTSTWLSTGTIRLYDAQIVRGYGNNTVMFTNTGFQGGPRPNPFYGESIQMDWECVGARKWLNEALLQALPNVLQINIKEVTKAYASSNVIPVNYYYRGSDRGQVKVEKTSMDKIWIPSVKELLTMMAATSNWSDFSSVEESTGIDYSSVYMPNWQNFMTRSLYVGSNYINPVLYESSSLTTTDGDNSNAPFGFCL